jgi:alpha-tubulin suppressor-like RCC1 family protein
VAYLARCARQRRCREASPTIAVALMHSFFWDAAGRLLACGKSATIGNGVAFLSSIYFDPTPVAALAGVRVRSVASGEDHCLALCSDGRVYSWGSNQFGQLGHGDELDRTSPVLVGGLKGVRGIAAAGQYSLAVTQSSEMFSWGDFNYWAEGHLRPTIVEGFGGVRVCHVSADYGIAFAIGEDGELFSWGGSDWKINSLGHGDWEDQPSPKRIEALRGVRVSSVSARWKHTLALTEDGLVYSWGENKGGALLGRPHVEEDGDDWPKPVEALRGVRVGSITAGYYRSYAVADTGEVWVWGLDNAGLIPPGYGAKIDRPLPEPIESLWSWGIKVDAVASEANYTLALADDGSVYIWGRSNAAWTSAIGLCSTVSDAAVVEMDFLAMSAVAMSAEAKIAAATADVPTPQRIPNLRVAFAL